MEGSRFNRTCFFKKAQNHRGCDVNQNHSIYTWKDLKQLHNQAIDLLTSKE